MMVPEAPSITPTLPTQDEQLQSAVARCVLSVLRAALRPGMSLDEITLRLHLVAEVFEKERADG